ncbi:family 2A encapsulin nanocompartment cargo protein cysteine desulfurase [Beijerinckia indica]|uniref:cysteine desulfurase n=1 Tax=Beijerinckia indica subsp. indica (strain ATCC 9039 / DSM 1715 / NCIMB 8712) TaxID=395963 RepID=B2IJK0_BEII9|nr:family 2A encapsulin nanocompartment cargo protein cysteine desulfurase [Beijerinckia indica]ACB94874.1 cysteine desulfurase, SufS subfamily [Beijerinckia indica subsp. indica ATCC 9039]
MPTIIPDNNQVAPLDPNLLARIAGELFHQGTVSPNAPLDIPTVSPPASPVPTPPLPVSSLPPGGTGVPPGGVALGGYGAPPPSPPNLGLAVASAPVAAPEQPVSSLSFTSLPPGGTGLPPGGSPLGGFGAVPSSLPGYGTLGVDTLGLAPIPPLAETFPSDAELKNLLGTSSQPQPSLDGIPPAIGSKGVEPNYYFLDGNSGFPQSAKPQTDPHVPTPNHSGFDAKAARADFPILHQVVNGHPLIWLDNAATTQKPNAVIDRLSAFYRHENSNIHRAAHELAARATDAYEGAREKTRRFLKAASVDEIIFVRGSTEGINLVAQSWGRGNIRAGDEIIITWLEHHANIVPWQMLCAEKGAKLKVVPVDNDGQVILEEYEKLLSDRTKLVSFTQVSNALGTVTPAQQMVAMARRYGAHVLVDGAQAVSHMPVDVQALDCDWYVLSGHKVFGPTGIGVVYGKQSVLENSPAWQGGGNMIKDVTFEKTEYQPSPARFEAGTGNIADAVGLGAAFDYLERLGMENVARHEHDLLTYATLRLSEIQGLRIIGTAKEKAGVVSFVLDGIKVEQVGQALNRKGIAVRAGHHCAQPILRRFGLEATVRPSLALYNTFSDIDALTQAVREIRAETLPTL